MSKNIDDMSKEFKKFAELQKFSESQLITINELSKKIKELEDERDHLKLLLESSPSLLEIKTGIPSNEELICLKQLELLKKESDIRELNLDESKKVKLYTDILQSLNSKEKKEKEAIKKVEDKDLLNVVEGDFGH